MKTISPNMSDGVGTANRARAMTDEVRAFVRVVARDSPRLKRALTHTEQTLGLLEHAVGQIVPAMIQPRPRRITIAVTAHCNLRCIGCRYGRDFMPGQQLGLEEVRSLLIDAKAAGVELVRLYGGEPLLHRDLAKMVRISVDLGLATYVTTNGMLLRQKIDELYSAGLRNITIGFYGTGEDYDRYVQRSDRYAELEAGMKYARAKYGLELSFQLNFLIMKPSCNPVSLQAAWDFAQRFDMSFHTDLIHYSLPYFTDGQEGGLQFGAEDASAIYAVVAELARLKHSYPTRVRESLASIHSIPDWLLKGAEMRIPCDVKNLLWVGADGSVQLCYVTFPLGNIREKPLRDMLFNADHRKAAQDAFKLNCPNCHCERDGRIQKHARSRIRYANLPAEPMTSA